MIASAIPIAPQPSTANRSAERSVAVVGGGITGLTAAYRLKQQGFQVTVFEAGHRVGGAIQSIWHNGYLAESGPNTILETSPKIGELVRDLKLEARKLYSSPRAERRFIVRGGKPVTVPASPLGFLTGDLFSWRAKAHLIAEPFVGRPSGDAEESLEQFVLRRLGREFLDYAINPFVAGVYAGDPARLSVKHAFPRLHAIEQKYRSLICGQVLGARERRRRGEAPKQSAKKLSFDEGLQVLIDALSAELAGSIVLRNPVEQIEESQGSWLVRSANVQRHFDSVLLAAPAHNLSHITFAPEQSQSLKALALIHYPPVTSLVFGFRREDVRHPLNGFGVLVPAVENMNILGAIFSSTLFPNRAPKGHVTLTVYVGGARNPLLATADRSTIRRLALADLASLLGVSGRPTFEHYTTYRQAIPQYEIGYGRFQDFMNQFEAESPGLFFAGNYRDGISLSDSIVSGHRAAERVGQFIQTLV